jgi:MFS family permease
MFIMIVELVASRLIAKYLGASLYTWTSIIGIILAGISLGNYVGGRLADRFTVSKLLAVELLIGALACFCLSMLNDFFGNLSVLVNIENWPTRIAFHITFTFLLPATMLGTIGPAAAKMALDLGRSTGRTLGNVYAWGAVGSIIGTFLTGYYLIAWYPVPTIINVVAAALTLMGLLYVLRGFILNKP